MVDYEVFTKTGNGAIFAAKIVIPSAIALRRAAGPPQTQAASTTIRTGYSQAKDPLPVSTAAAATRMTTTTASAAAETARMVTSASTSRLTASAGAAGAPVSMVSAPI